MVGREKLHNRHYKNLNFRIVKVIFDVGILKFRKQKNFMVLKFSLERIQKMLIVMNNTD